MYNIIFYALGILVLVRSGNTAESKPNLKTLRVAQVLFRHGARSIDQTFPTDPYKDESFWAPGYSQVTNEGKLQAFELGVFLRERYDGFIKSTYDLNELHVLSSDLPRTIQTAYSVCAGFYLPNTPPLEENQTTLDAISRNEVEIQLPWKSVPVHTIPVEYDNTLRQTVDICPKYDQDLIENLDAFPGKEERDEAFAILSKNGGIEINTYSLYARLYDALVVEGQRNMTLPSWTKGFYNTGIGYKVFLAYFPYLLGSDERKRLRTGPLLSKFIENMRRNESQYQNEFVKSTTGQKKMYFYSGHDHTLYSAMVTLGVNNGKRASYCSALILELHQNETNPEEEYIEVYYRNETERDPYQLIIPECGQPCTFQRFVEILDPYIPTDWQKECQILEQSSTISAGWILAIILIVWVVFFLVLQCWLQGTRCFSGRKRKNSYSVL